MRIHLGCTGAPEQNQRTADQQTHARPETPVSRRAERCQQQRPAELAQRIAGAIERHQTAAPLFHGELVNPAFTEHEHHGQRHAEEQPQPHPDRIILHQRQASHRQRTEQQTQLHQHGGTETCRQAPGQRSSEQHTNRRSGRHHTNGKRIIAPAFQAQRHQRHGHAQRQPDADDRRADGEVGAPTHW